VAIHFGVGVYNQIGVGVAIHFGVGVYNQIGVGVAIHFGVGVKIKTTSTNIKFFLFLHKLI
jgi:hypothetical protein